MWEHSFDKRFEHSEDEFNYAQPELFDDYWIYNTCNYYQFFQCAEKNIKEDKKIEKKKTNFTPFVICTAMLLASFSFIISVI